MDLIRTCEFTCVRHKGPCPSPATRVVELGFGMFAAACAHCATKARVVSGSDRQPPPPGGRP